VVIVSIETLRVPHVPPAERVTVDDLGYRDDGITHMTARFGFMDKINVPATVRMAAEQVEGDLDLDRASYFLSRIAIVMTDAPGMAHWRKRLFIAIARNAANPVGLFGLPEDQTVVLSAHVEV
jgi:KUP system potassium uptake protein